MESKTNSYNLGMTLSTVDENINSYVRGTSPKVKASVFGLPLHEFNKLKNVPSACYVFDPRKK